MNRARRILQHAGLSVQSLTHYEGDQFTVTADTAQDILSIAAVHPLREDALRRILARSQADWQTVEQLVAAGRLRKNVHNRKTYYRTIP